MSQRSRSLAAAAGAGLFLAALSVAAAQAPATSAPQPGRRINVNQASAAQLAFLPRIGATAAGRIVAYRKQHGPFTRLEDLMEVKGIGERLFLSLKPFVALAGPTTLAEKVRVSRRPKTAAAPPPAAGRKPASAAAVPVGKGR